MISLILLELLNALLYILSHFGGFFTGEEMFSDIYKIKESENGMMIEVEGKVCWLYLIKCLTLILQAKALLFTYNDDKLRTPL